MYLLLKWEKKWGQGLLIRHFGLFSRTSVTHKLAWYHQCGIFSFWHQLPGAMVTIICLFSICCMDRFVECQYWKESKGHLVYPPFATLKELMFYASGFRKSERTKVLKSDLVNLNSSSWVCCVSLGNLFNLSGVFSFINFVGYLPSKVMMIVLECMESLA